LANDAVAAAALRRHDGRVYWRRRQPWSTAGGGLPGAELPAASPVVSGKAYARLCFPSGNRPAPQALWSTRRRSPAGIRHAVPHSTYGVLHGGEPVAVATLVGGRISGAAIFWVGTLPACGVGGFGGAPPPFRGR